MDKKNKADKTDFSISLSEAATLRGRQSVRATFRLSAEFIDALRALSAQLGIKQKSLFDHLMEDMASLRALADRARPGLPDKKNRVQKTFVISRKSLTALDTVSKDVAASRDDLVEYSIQRLLPILLQEREKQTQRERAMEKIAAHFNETADLLDEIMVLLGEDDPISKTMDSVLAAYAGGIDTMQALIESGKQITDLPMEKLKG